MQNANQRPIHDVKPSKVFNHQNGGEEIKPGTLHGGEEIKPGTLHGGEEIKPGTLHNSVESLKSGQRATFSPATYRTKDGSAYYKFRYVDIGGKFEIDIVEQPSYENRSAASNVTHRLSSERGGQKICISAGHEPTALESAKNISMEWAELTHEYIKSGRTLDQQVLQNAKANRSGIDNKIGGFWKWLFG